MSVCRWSLPTVSPFVLIAFSLLSPALGQQQPQQPQTQPGAQPRPHLPFLGPKLPPGAQLPANNPQGQRQVIHPVQAIQPPPVQQAPIQLTTQQQLELDQALKGWQDNSSKISTLTCVFTMWEYDGVFGPQNKARSESQGEVKFIAPDKGLYHVVEIKDFNAAIGAFQPAQRDGEYWMCTGKAIYEFNGPKKQLIERPLPKELQGKAISDGPLPFLFGVEAEKLKARYFMRVITPPNVKDQVWIEAYPRFQQDAANFQRVEIILSTQNMLPFAMQLYLPNGKSRTVYQFKDVAINGLIQGLLKHFFEPRTPAGWTKIVDDPHLAQGVQPGSASQPAGQAQQPTGTVPR